MSEKNMHAYEILRMKTALEYYLLKPILTSHCATIKNHDERERRQRVYSITIATIRARKWEAVLLSLLNRRCAVPYSAASENLVQ